MGVNFGSSFWKPIVFGLCLGGWEGKKKHNVLEPKRNMDQSIGYVINTDFFDMCQHVWQVFDKYLKKKVLHLHLNR